MQQRVYDSPEWQRLRDRVLARDADRCTVARLIGGDCHPTLHAHHLITVKEGGAPFDDDNVITVCARHHPMIEALRRRLAVTGSQIETRRCRHHHPYPQGREACERRQRRIAA